MKKVIFTQDWMAMHPYEKPNEVDQYYTELANEIYHALDEACFTHQFKNVEDAKQLALSIAGYFEDVISGAGIWKTFTAECKKRYGSYIPFYENEDDFVPNTLNEDVPEYDPEEINFADIKFLCWHHYQQSTYIQEAVPFLFSTMTLAAKLAYNLLDKEYETAPENERLVTYLSEMPVLENQNEEEEKQLDEIHRRDTLAWFHYGCYFNVGNRQRLQFALQQMANSPQGLTEPMAYSVQMLDEDVAAVPDDECVVRSHNSLGHGVTEDVTDVVYVKTDDNFTASNNPAIAREIEKINREYLDNGKNYVLVGPGRWGSSDPWLGIPVKWPHISAARVIVEVALKNYRVDPSQGTHFFQNLTSFGVGYFTVDANRGEGLFHKEMLDEMEAVEETEHVRVVRFNKPLRIMMDGKKQEYEV